MIRIDYKNIRPEIKEENGKELIFCVNRKKWLVITPEEWVRQNFLQYLVEVMHYPLSLIAVEKQVLLGDLKKRFDVIVYTREGKPFMIVECKEMNVPLSESVLQQALRYNISLQAPYIIITNGSFCAAYKNDGEGFQPISELPAFRLASDKKNPA